MATRLLQCAQLIGVVLLAVSAELDTDRVQQFNFKTASHYRTEYKDRSGKVFGEYGVHMPGGWTRVTRYQTTDDNVHQLVQEYRKRTNQLLEDERRTTAPIKLRKLPQNEELDNETEPEIRIIAVPHLWKVRGQDLLPSASERRPVTLALAEPAATLAPPALTEQRALYNFGYDAPYHGHNETGTESGAKFGQYYVDLPNCWRSVVRYYADETGYHPTLRQIRTPGCEQQKREVIRPVPAAESGEGGTVGTSSQEDRPSASRDGRPGAVTPGGPRRTAAEVPAAEVPPAASGVPAAAAEVPVKEVPVAGIPAAASGVPAAIAEVPAAVAEVPAAVAEVPAAAPSQQRETVDPSRRAAPSSAPTCGGSGGRGGSDGLPPAPGRPYGFAYNAGTHYHWERGFANGTKVGAYAVQLPDGTLRTTTYTADCNGFKPSISVEPIDQAKFLRDFEAFNPPKEAKLFELGGQPQASALVRSEPAAAPPNLLRRRPATQAGERSAEVAGAPPRLALREEQRKVVTTSPAPTTTEPATTAETTPPPTTAETTPPPTTTEAATTTETTPPPTTTSTSTAPPTTTTAPPRTAASPRRPPGGSSRSPARRLAPIRPVRPVGSGQYHFYVHLRHNYHEERGYENGTVAGQYGVVGPDGVLREVGYTSERGFVPTLTDTPVAAGHDLSSRPEQL